MSETILPDLQALSPLQLLQVHSAAAEELQRRGPTRSANNPVGDLAKGLFCDCFGWKIAPPWLAAADAIDDRGIRYQIKARRLVGPGSSRQLSAIRNLDKGGFDVLAAVLFDRTYAVAKAALIPHSLVAALARHQTHTNSAIFILADSVWARPEVRDVTSDIRTCAARWSVPH